MANNDCINFHYQFKQAFIFIRRKRCLTDPLGMTASAASGVSRRQTGQHISPEHNVFSRHEFLRALGLPTEISLMRTIGYINTFYRSRS